MAKLSPARTDFAENVLFVISPVPFGEEDLKAERLKEAAGRFAEAMSVSRDLGSQLLTVPYHPQIALTEKSFIFHHPRSPLAGSFSPTCPRYPKRNPADLGMRFKKLMAEMKRGGHQAVPVLLELPALLERAAAPRASRCAHVRGDASFDTA